MMDDAMVVFVSEQYLGNLKVQFNEIISQIKAGDITNLDVITAINEVVVDIDAFLDMWYTEEENDND